MANLRHYVVMLDENGNTVRNMKIVTSDNEAKEFTKDWSEALHYCGMLNHSHSSGIGGYEIISEPTIGAE